MTNKEALEICNAAIKVFSLSQQEIIDEYTEYVASELTKQYDIQIMTDAIEKQIPVKPEEKFEIDWTIKVCPKCGHELRRPYPCICGQKIDWRR